MKIVKNSIPLLPSSNQVMPNPPTIEQENIGSIVSTVVSGNIVTMRICCNGQFLEVDMTHKEAGRVGARLLYGYMCGEGE